MKANLLTLWTTLLCGTVALHAQEPQQGSMQPEGRFRQEAPQSPERNDGSGLQPLADSLARMEFLYAEPATLPGDWLDQGDNPFARQKERERQQMQQMRERARTSVLAIPRLSNDLVNKNGFRWRMTVGYLPMNNWSPYEDRWLDARIIRMPLPRDMRPDKRPIAEQRRDALRKSRR